MPRRFYLVLSLSKDALRWCNACKCVPPHP
jgi:hypothetical protein